MKRMLSLLILLGLVVVACSSAAETPPEAPAANPAVNNEAEAVEAPADTAETDAEPVEEIDEPAELEALDVAEDVSDLASENIEVVEDVSDPASASEDDAEAPPATDVTEAVSEPSGYTPEFTRGDCPINIPSQIAVECGVLTVPENRQTPDNGRTVQLPVAIFKSDNLSPAPDPVVYLAGGPGGAALEIVEFVFDDQVEPFLGQRDFILFDQRGAGLSEPSLECYEITDLILDSLDVVLPVAEQSAFYLEAMTRCHDRLVDEGIELSAYNSANNAADVRDLRLALGYDEWNLYGISYGTRLAQTVVRDHPQGVRSVILDSVYPIEVSLPVGLPANLARGFETFFAGCAADSACQDLYPDLESRFFALVDQLNETPAEFPITYLLSGEQYDVVFRGYDLVSLVFQALYSNEVFPSLPQVITEVEAGNYDQLALIFSSFLINNEFLSDGMYRSVQCHEEISFSEEAEVQTAVEADPQYSEFFADWELDFQTCAVWDVGQAEALENEPVVSDLPTLVLTGEYDPITPPAWGELVSESLTRDFYFEIPSVGHGASTSDSCAMSIVQRFLADPQTDPAATCIAEIAPPVFVVEVDDTPPELVAFTTDLPAAQIEGVVPAGWEEIRPGAFARGRTGLDQTVLLFQAVPGLSGEQVAELFSQEVGIADSIQATMEYRTADERVWQLYEASLSGLPVNLATYETDGLTYLALLISEEAETTLLYEAVFLPALEALR